MRTENKRYKSKKQKEQKPESKVEPQKFVLDVQNGTLGSKSDLGGK